MSAKFFVGPG